MLVFVIVIAAVGLIALGILIAQGPPAPSVGKNNPDLAVCPDLCEQWLMRRFDRCNAEAAEASAQATVLPLVALLAIAIATAAGLWLAYFAALSSPLTEWAAPLLGVLAMAASGSVFVILGSLAQKLADASNKAKDAQRARDTEAQALAQLNSKCKDEEQKNACLSVPSPC